MRTMPRRLIVATGVVLLTAGAAGAQIVVSDPAVTLRDQIIADLKRQLLDTLTQEADRIRQMAQRLTAVTSLQKYATGDDVPEWRIHVFWGDEFLYANPYTAALNYGDGSGSAFKQVAVTRVDPAAILPANLVDLLPITQAAVVLPLPSYSLKVIEKYVGFKRALAEANGDWSMAAFIEAVETNDPAHRETLMDAIRLYNREDLDATWVVLNWLRDAGEGS